MKGLRWVIGLAGAALLMVAPAAAQEPDASYKVKAGDTLYELAERYLTRTADYAVVQRLNRIGHPRRLPVGRSLHIPGRLLRTEPVPARLAAFRGPVSISASGGAPQPRVGLPLQEGAQVATGPNAAVTLELPDGSRIALPSQSRLRIVRLRRVLMTGAVMREFEVGAGRSSSVVAPAAQPGDRFIVRTPRTVAAVRGTEFRVNHDEGTGRSTVEILEGSVDAASSSAPQTSTALGAGYGALAGPEGLSPPQALLAPPVVPAADLLQDEPVLRFRVAGPDGAQRHRAQVAVDAGFIDVIAESEGDGGEVSLFGLRNGAYFARFTALDGAGLEGLPVTYAIERRLNAVGMETPAAVPGARRQYLFRWRTEGDGTSVSRFVLSRSADGSSPLVDLPGLAEGSVVVTDLPKGVYYWRVLVSRFESSGRYDKWTASQRFEIGR